MNGFGVAFAVAGGILFVLGRRPRGAGPENTYDGITGRASVREPVSACSPPRSREA